MIRPCKNEKYEYQTRAERTKNDGTLRIYNDGACKRINN
jgi:hypothetical protein